MRNWLVPLLLFSAAAHGETYCFGFLNSHPERKQIPETQAEEIQKGHMAHLNRMGREGHLLVAGPLATPGGARGIVVYRCASLDQARAWTALDPAVQNKRLSLEAYLWMGPDGVGEPLAGRMKKDPDTKVEMVRLPLIVARKTEKWTGDLPEATLQDHLNQVRALEAEGKLRAAGPFVDGEGRAGTIPGIAGVFVFRAMPLEDALALANQDPMVRDGYARMDGYVWFVAEDAIPKR